MSFVRPFAWFSNSCVYELHVFVKYNWSYSLSVLRCCFSFLTRRTETGNSSHCICLEQHIFLVAERINRRELVIWTWILFYDRSNPCGSSRRANHDLPRLSKWFQTRTKRKWPPAGIPTWRVAVADPDLVLHYNPLGPLDDVLEANSSRLEEDVAPQHQQQRQQRARQRSINARINTTTRLVVATLSFFLFVWVTTAQWSTRLVSQGSSSGV